MDDKIVFGEQKPAITEVTVVEAARIWSGGDGIISLNGKRRAGRFHLDARNHR